MASLSENIMFKAVWFGKILNSTYNRDSTYNYSWSESRLSTGLMIESFGKFLNSTYNRDSTYTLPTENKYGQGSVWSKIGTFKSVFSSVKVLPHSYKPDMF